MTVDQIRSKLQELKDDQRAQGLRRFFKTGPGEYGEGDVFLGIRVPDLRSLAREHRAARLSEIRQLLKSRFHEERVLALMMLVHAYSKGDEDAKKRIYDLYLKSTDYINNWDLVDLSAHHIVGQHLSDRSREPLYRLAKSESLWERRIAIIATAYFIKRGEFKETLKISKLLLSDKEDLIHKAVGWMLREVGKRDLATEERFLIAHYKRMPRTMLRYAIERFPEPRRQMYLKGII
ncbi:MAG TPA: DNA alkylation repair protein [Blastocatellia bacterium]|nr:DNA alkylation repair protein [Blastocatellia bacterium]